jgi:hypothetical protein
MTIRFNDGMEINTSGPLRIIQKRDGLYITGDGLLIPIRDTSEGRDIIHGLEKTKKRRDE